MTKIADIWGRNSLGTYGLSYRARFSFYFHATLSSAAHSLSLGIAKYNKLFLSCYRQFILRNNHILDFLCLWYIFEISLLSCSCFFGKDIICLWRWYTWKKITIHLTWIKNLTETCQSCNSCPEPLQRPCCSRKCLGMLFLVAAENLRQIIEFWSTSLPVSSIIKYIY